MARKKKQKVKPGIIVKIPCKDGKYSFAKVLIGRTICVYDYQLEEKQLQDFSIETMLQSPILFYVSLYEGVIEDGLFEIVGYSEVTEKELSSIPPVFYQDKKTLECEIHEYLTSNKYKASPEECIWLEPPAVYPDYSVIDRLYCHYNNKKDLFLELHKVILTKEDPRCQAPFIKWDFAKEEWIIDQEKLDNFNALPPVTERKKRG